jgi:hypothetical protein
VNTFVQPDDPREVILIEGWDSSELQQQYLRWRQESGGLVEFRSFLASDPVFEYWQLSKV